MVCTRGWCAHKRVVVFQGARVRQDLVWRSSLCMWRVLWGKSAPTTEHSCMYMAWGRHPGQPGSLPALVVRASPGTSDKGRVQQPPASSRGDLLSAQWPLRPDKSLRACGPFHNCMNTLPWCGRTCRRSQVSQAQPPCIPIHPHPCTPAVPCRQRSKQQHSPAVPGCLGSCWLHHFTLQSVWTQASVTQPVGTASGRGRLQAAGQCGGGCRNTHPPQQRSACSVRAPTACASSCAPLRTTLLVWRGSCSPHRRYAAPASAWPCHAPATTSLAGWPLRPPLLGEAKAWLIPSPGGAAIRSPADGPPRHSHCRAPSAHCRGQ